MFSTTRVSTGRCLNPSQKALISFSPQTQLRWVKLSAAPSRGGDPAPRPHAVSVETVSVETATVSDERDRGEASTSNGNSTRTRVFKLKSAACYLPHPDKLSYGGEDAHFVSQVGGGAVGVADGVGGWAAEGVNPAEYSRTFMRVACEFIEGSKEEQASSNFKQRIDPRGALQAAHDKTRVPGSATAVVVQLDQEKQEIVAANLGDSGFLIIRGGKVIIRSKALEHHFDCPLQFGAFPEFVEVTDTADMADIYTLKVQRGDVLVAGSDGLWDNTYEEEVIAIAPLARESPRKAAQALAALARQHASDPEFASPYTREALTQGFDLPWHEKLLGTKFQNGRFKLGELTGGKQDDITVIVGRVAEEEELTRMLASVAGEVHSKLGWVAEGMFKAAEKVVKKSL